MKCILLLQMSDLKKTEGSILELCTLDFSVARQGHRGGGFCRRQSWWSTNRNASQHMLDRIASVAKQTRDLQEFRGGEKISTS